MFSEITQNSLTPVDHQTLLTPRLLLNLTSSSEHFSRFAVLPPRLHRILPPHLGVCLHPFSVVTPVYMDHLTSTLSTGDTCFCCESSCAVSSFRLLFVVLLWFFCFMSVMLPCFLSFTSCAHFNHRPFLTRVFPTTKSLSRFAPLSLLLLILLICRVSFLFHQAKGAFSGKGANVYA